MNGNFAKWDKAFVVAVFILMKWLWTIFNILAYSDGVWIEKNHTYIVMAFLAYHGTCCALSLYKSPFLFYPCYHATELQARSYGPSKNIISFTGLH